MFLIATFRFDLPKHFGEIFALSLILSIFMSANMKCARFSCHLWVQFLTKLIKEDYWLFYKFIIFRFCNRSLNSNTFLSYFTCSILFCVLYNVGSRQPIDGEHQIKGNKELDLHMLFHHLIIQVHRYFLAVSTAD